jgi:beta-mannosidase
VKKVCLNKGWRLHEAPLEWDRNMASRVEALGDGWMPCELPCDIHTPLQEAGRIGDVVEADNSFAAEWTELRSWWFTREFDGGEVDTGAAIVELTLTMLDAYADVFLNGEWLGTHESAFYPFTIGIKDRVRPGKNTLAVRVTTGLENVSDADLAQINRACSHEKGNGCPERGDIRRPFVRRPQYSVGWDWAPKALTCGITGDAFIRTYGKTAVRGART